MVLSGAPPLLQARAAGKFQVLAYKVTLKTPSGEQVRPRHSRLPKSRLGAAAAGVGAAMRGCGGCQAACGHDGADPRTPGFSSRSLLPASPLRPQVIECADDTYILDAAEEAGECDEMQGKPPSWPACAARVGWGQAAGLLRG
jgi:hypothetical protein